MIQILTWQTDYNTELLNSLKYQLSNESDSGTHDEYKKGVENNEIM